MLGREQRVSTEPAWSIMEKEGLSMLPEDPMILLSYVNTKLRDEYDSLEDLCEALDTERDALEERMKQIGYVYTAEQNRFV